MLLLLRLFSALLARVPEAMVAAAAAVLGDLLYFALPGRRHALLSNLSHAFPEKPDSWLRRTGRASCRQLAETALLGAAYASFPEERIRRMLTAAPSFEANLARALTAGRPIVAATPHLGAWELETGLPLVTAQAMPEAAIIYRPLDHAALDSWVRRSRERFGFRLLSRKEGFTEGMEILRRGGALAMLFDQSAGDRGELTLFFDRVCSSTNLPGLMVEKFDASLAMLFLRRRGFWRYEMEMVLPGQPLVTAAEVTRFLDRWLEELLRGDEVLCRSWLWLHNRWKTQVLPQRRFRLEHKRSLLPADGSLPRRTRFFVRFPNWLGDVVLALPLVRALRRSRPDAAITALIKPALAPLLERTGLCENVLSLPPRGLRSWRFFRRLRRRYPDCWVLLTNSARGDIEARLAGCRQRFGMVRPGKRRPLLSHAWRMPPDVDETREHQLRVWERFFRHFGLQGDLDLSPVGLDALPQSPLAPLASRLAPPVWVGMIAGTENLPAKRWPVPHWRELIERLRARAPETRVVLFGTPGDRAITREVAAGFSSEHLVDLAGQTDLLQFASGLRSCSLVVANDTGGMHLANMLGVPLLALFGPTNPVRTGPVFGGDVHTLQPPGSPATGGASLDAIPPERVVQAALGILASRT